MEGMKSLVNVEMVMQNRVTRVTYRVTSTLPIGMILPKVSYTQHLHKIGYIGEGDYYNSLVLLVVV